MKTVIRNINIINGKKDVELLNNMTIIIDNGLIEDIKSYVENEDFNNSTIIEGNNQYILPGLINSHAHLFSGGQALNKLANENILKLIYPFIRSKIGKKFLYRRMRKNLWLELKSGVTSVRSLGEFFYLDVKLRNNIIKHKMVLPNYFVSGYFLSTTDGHGAPFLALESDGPWLGRKNVRKNVKKSVNWIKVCVTGGVTDAVSIGEAGRVQFTEEELRAICEEAHKNGTMVAAHAESTEGVRIALKAGVDTIEHGAAMDEEIIGLFRSNPRTMRGYSALIPTFSAAYPFAFPDRETEKQMGTVMIENSKMVFKGMKDGFIDAIKNDILVGAGNDAGMTFVQQDNFFSELIYQEKVSHLEPGVIIENATSNNSKILGINEEAGTVEIGKKADLIIVKENPLESIANIKQLTMVLKDGQVI